MTKTVARGQETHCCALWTYRWNEMELKFHGIAWNFQLFSMVLLFFHLMFSLRKKKTISVEFSYVERDIPGAATSQCLPRVINLEFTHKLELISQASHRLPQENFLPTWKSSVVDYVINISPFTWIFVKTTLTVHNGQLSYLSCLQGSSLERCYYDAGLF